MYNVFKTFGDLIKKPVFHKRMRGMYMLQAKKMVRYKACILAKTVLLMDQLNQSDCTITELYDHVQNEFEDFNEFLLTLDALFVLGKIRYDHTHQIIFCTCRTCAGWSKKVKNGQKKNCTLVIRCTVLFFVQNFLLF